MRGKLKSFGFVPLTFSPRNQQEHVQIRRYSGVQRIYERGALSIYVCLCLQRNEDCTKTFVGCTNRWLVQLFEKTDTKTWNYMGKRSPCRCRRPASDLNATGMASFSTQSSHLWCDIEILVPTKECSRERGSFTF